MAGFQHRGFILLARFKMPVIRPLPLLALTLSVVATTSQAEDALPCKDEKLFGDERRLECTIALKPGETSARFVALFSGGHDDTQASMKAQVDGADMDCGPGSKPELMGEDGNVYLLCQLPVGRLSPGPHVVAIHLRWHHAQYEGYRLER